MATPQELEAEIAALQEKLKAAQESPKIIGKDAKGQDVKVGDDVTLTLKVAGVHHTAFRDDDGKERAGFAVNLSTADGKHLFTADATHVTRV